MNFDEQISKRVDKQMLNELVNENVNTSPTRTLYKHTLNKIRTLGMKVSGVFFDLDQHKILKSQLYSNL